MPRFGLRPVVGFEQNSCEIFMGGVIIIHFIALCPQFFRRGSAPDPIVETHDAPQTPSQNWKCWSVEVLVFCPILELWPCLGVSTIETFEYEN